MAFETAFFREEVMSRSWLVLTALVLLLSRPAALWAEEIDAYVEAQMKQQRMPGLSLAVVKEGKVILAKGYGFANVEHKVPVKPETIFQSGSVGKQFTATAVMMLVEEGKLGLADKISKYLEDTPEAWKEITVRHLLTHTSGIKTYSPKDLNFRQDYTEAELVKKAASFRLDFPPGEKWRYSNTGYVLLGVIIRKASREFYGDFLHKRVFLPLGMETARIINEADIVPNRAAGYRMVKGELKNQEWVSPSLNTTADGSLYLTVLDMAKWDAALYTEKLLKHASLEQMWTPVKTTDGKAHPYGFGWQVRVVRGQKVIEHGGAWQGFVTAIVRYPDDKLTVIVLTNLAAAGVNPGKIAHGVAALYIPELAPKK
jgi:CubicO group peptidase (beta-lactamase class C family)